MIGSRILEASRLAFIRRNLGGKMSHDIRLIDSVTKETIILDEPHQMKGGTYQVGGSYEAYLNVTYNYGEIFSEVFKDIDRPAKNGAITKLYGLTGAESIPIIKQAIASLRDDVVDDYWTPTEGNVKQALIKLLALATMRPDGIWDGD